MVFQYNGSVSAEALADLRESVSWNRMENEYGSPLSNVIQIRMAERELELK